MRIQQGLLEQGQKLYEQMSTEDKVLSDPVIWPFGMAMRIGGYTPAIENECLILRSCPICPVGKGNYSTKYQKETAVYWGCPHCQNITE
tara:strand:+ start:16723 stop:16989 length:267 start_codon:yes stop_codon:yes gene_type:complete